MLKQKWQPTWEEGAARAKSTAKGQGQVSEKGREKDHNRYRGEIGAIHDTVQG